MYFPIPLFSCCLLLLGILLQFYLLILLNSFEEEHGSLSDSEKQELKLYGKKNVIVSSRTHPINFKLLPSLLRWQMYTLWKSPRPVISDIV